ncbi:MAG: GNAT family N-acetyltransferase [Cyclobacteriaceae bacterium]|nr:GNAT family N-acetyltransferase [Cyclobacteriaceae bacterium]
MSSGYQFVSGETVGPASGYTPSLFHLPVHLCQRQALYQSFFIVHTKRKCTCGEVHFHSDDVKAISRLYAPFGSFLFDENLPAEVLSDFIGYCEGELIRRDIREVELIHAPLLYFPRQYDLLHPLLVQRGYALVHAEVSALLSVKKDDFELGLHTWEARKLRQARTAGLTARELPLQELMKIYDFILRCRQHKGYYLSMGRDEVNQLGLSFPDRTHLFAVYDNNEIAAAALCLRVTNDVLYAFYYDHHEAYDSVSPVVLLMKFIYNWCRTNDFRFIDLGTSSINGELNFSLLAFKRHLGAQLSPRYTFRKSL